MKKMKKKEEDCGFRCCLDCGKQCPQEGDMAGDKWLDAHKCPTKGEFWDGVKKRYTPAQLHAAYPDNYPAPDLGKPPVVTCAVCGSSLEPDAPKCRFVNHAGINVALDIQTKRA